MVEVISTKVKVTQLIKRDHRKVPFVPFKLKHCLKKIMPAESTEEIVTIYAEVLNCCPQEKLTSEVLENKLVEVLTQHHQLAAIANYRAGYQAKQEALAAAMNVQQRLQRLAQRDERVVHENANKDSEVFNTLRDLTAGTVARAEGLRMLPPAVAKAHLKGDLHWHDLDYQPFSPLTNCCLIDFKGMLTQGFKIGNADVEPPQSIQTAAAQMAQIIANVASSQYGGCSADRVDEVLAPFAEKNFHKHQREAKEWIDDPEKAERYAYSRTKKDIYDAMQSLEYEINTLYSSQGQTPFTTLGFGLGRNWFAVEIQRAILQIRIEGLGKEKRTAIFPKLVFTLKQGLNLKSEDPNYEIKQLAIKCATQRMYPDVVSYDQIIRITGSFKAPMGCRSFLQAWQDDQGNEIASGRMNLGVVTLNLPRLAMLSEGKQNLFWQLLASELELCHEALKFKVKRTKAAKPENAPILYEYGAFGERLKPGESVDTLFKKSRATVSLGYIGLYEVGTVFFGPDWETNSEAKTFTLRILKIMSSACQEWENNEGYHYSVYGTPSESLTDTFCRDDVALFGQVANITDKEYYTNSFHYDVRKSITPFEKLDFEKDYAQYSAGGFIHYCEYPNLRQNPKALEAVWDFAYDKIGYLGTNTPIDQCFECGFKGEFAPTAKGFECPVCHNHNPLTCDVVRRTCGYLGNPIQRPMVHGRHEEIVSRHKHLSLGNDRFNQHS